MNKIILPFLFATGILFFYCTDYVFAQKYDIELIEVKILGAEIISLKASLDNPTDYSDLLKIPFNVTNNGVENYVMKLDMFNIEVIDPSLVSKVENRLKNDFRLDTYFPTHFDKLKVRYDDFPKQNFFEDCDRIDHRIEIGHTTTLTVCFDVLRKWHNEALNLGGQKKHSLYIMDNKFSTSCPNCKIFPLFELAGKPKMEQKITPKNVPLTKLSPFKQLQKGILPQEIICKTDFNLIFKPTDSSPACVKSSTKSILIQRGWIVPNPEIPILDEIGVFQNNQEEIEARRTSSSESNSDVIKEKTILTFVKFQHIIFNGGYPIVFEGKLTNEFGDHIPDVYITIKNDGPCPEDHFIANGTTNNYGRYWIKINSKIWDEKDNMIRIHAEFNGNEKYLPSKSIDQYIVVLPTSSTEKCLN